jgi:integrase-like protein
VLNPVERAKRPYAKHGLTSLKQAVKGLGGRVIDRRTTLGKSLAKWRADLVSDLGGKDAISTQQSAVVELAVRTKLLLDSIDAWLLTQPSLVNVGRRALLPAVRERQQLADTLAKYMTTLGLERRARRVPSLAEYIATGEEEVAQIRDTTQPTTPRPAATEIAKLGPILLGRNQRGEPVEGSADDHRQPGRQAPARRTLGVPGPRLLDALACAPHGHRRAAAGRRRAGDLPPPHGSLGLRAPVGGWKEVVVVTGRQSGKSRIAAAIATIEAARAAGRTVEMSQQLGQSLRRLELERKAETLERGWSEVPPWVFCTEVATPLDESRVRKVFARMLRVAGLPTHFSPHSLRHTYASLLLSAGESPAFVQRQLGHASIQLAVDTTGSGCRWATKRP